MHPYLEEDVERGKGERFISSDLLEFGRKVRWIVRVD